MKKSLVALAALSVIGAASAQSTVTLYGLADVYVGSDRVGRVSNTVVSSGGLNGSRWGLRVSEDLGGGLAAIAQIESGFDISTGAGQQGALFGRQAFVGVKSGWGQLTVGRQYGVYDDMKGALSLQGNSSFDATGGRGATAAGTVAGNVGAWTGYAPRINNAIKFQSANYSGFTAGVTYGLGEDKTAARSASSSISIGAMYANGPITVGVVHQNEGFTRTLPGNRKNELENTLFAGAYDFGVVKLGGGYNEARARVAGVTSPKAKEWFLGASVPLGALTLKAQYARSKVSNQNADDSIGLQAEYDMSKRTTAYFGFNSTKLKSINDNTNRRVGVGIRHKF